MCRSAVAAFSLIELLAVTAILMLIVLCIAALMVGGGRTRDQAEARARVNLDAAAALGAIARDLEQAVCDPLLSFCLQPDRNEATTHGARASELCCLVPGAPRAAPAERSVQQAYYWIEPMASAGPSTNRFRLVRGLRPVRASDAATPLATYGNTLWFEPGRTDNASGIETVGVLAENVTAFRLLAGLPDGRLTDDYWSADWSNRPPAFVDVLLELLDPQTARRAEDLADRPADCTRLVENNAVRFTTRVVLRAGRRFSPP